LSVFSFSAPKGKPIRLPDTHNVDPPVYPKEDHDALVEQAVTDTNNAPLAAPPVATNLTSSVAAVSSNSLDNSAASMSSAAAAGVSESSPSE
jgi:hypothetical protein